LDWGREPWDGQSPRSLARLRIQEILRKRFGTCVVDNSVILCAGREASRSDLDPAQYLSYISDGGSFSHGS